MMDGREPLRQGTPEWDRAVKDVADEMARRLRLRRGQIFLVTIRAEVEGVNLLAVVGGGDR